MEAIESKLRKVEKNERIVREAAKAQEKEKECLYKEEEEKEKK